MKPFIIFLLLLCVTTSNGTAQDFSIYDQLPLPQRTDSAFAIPVLLPPDSLSSTSIIVQTPLSPRYADLSSTSISSVFLYDVALDSTFTRFVAQNVYSKNPYIGLCQYYPIIRIPLIKLHPATTYYYRLRALFDINTANPPNASRFSTTASFRTPLVSLPTIVTSIATIQLSHDAVTLTWFPAEGKPTEYGVQAATDSLFTSIAPGYDAFRVRVQNDTARSETQARITGLKSGTRYYFRVQSRNAQGVSAFSPFVFNETFVVPRKFTARGMTYDEGIWSTSIPKLDVKRVYLPKTRLSLRDADSILSVVVQKGIALEAAWFQDSSSCRFDDKYPSALTVKLTVPNSTIDGLQFGRSSNSSEQWIQCHCKNYRYYYNFDTQVSVQETQEAATALVLEQSAPNPTDGEATISFSLPETTQVRLSLHDMLGREVLVIAESSYTTGRHSIPLSLNRLPQGIYTYRLSARGQTAAKQMLIVR